MFDVIRTGAAGNGSTDDTAAIQRAIDSAEGGGEVFLPAGVYRTTTLHMKNGVTMTLAPGARLIASPFTANWEKSAGMPLICAENARDITLRGAGELSCNGPAFHGELGYRFKCAIPLSILRFTGCGNIRVEGLTLRDAVGWTAHFNDCEHLTVEDVTIRNPECTRARNNDGIDINGCRHVLVKNCDIETGDDAICLKNVCPGNPAAPRNAMFDIRVQDCVLASTSNITKIGTETVGDIYDVEFSGIAAHRHSGAMMPENPAEDARSISAISIQTNDGAKVHDITCRDYFVSETDTAFFIQLGNRQTLVPGSPAGELYNITLENIHVLRSHRTSLINVCEGGRICNVKLSDLRIHNHETRFCDRAPERPGQQYPEPWQYGFQPAFGLFARDVDGLSLQHAEFYDDGRSGRLPLVLENVRKT